MTFVEVPGSMVPRYKVVTDPPGGFNELVTLVSNWTE